MFKLFLVTTSVCLVSFTGVSAQSTGVARLAFLQGCWEASTAQGQVEEQWMAPRGDNMVGFSRTVKDGHLREFELMVVRERDDKLTYDARPMGQSGGVFTSMLLDEGRAIFENPVHDFPQRIGYERQGADALLAWIEGDHEGGLRRFEYPYRRVSCLTR